MKTFILPLSSYLKIDQNKSMAEFVKLGVPTWEMLLHWFKFPSFLEQYVAKVRGPSLTFLFDEFNKGNLSATQFRTALRNKFSVLANKTDPQIDAAWNAMCIVTDFTMAAFNEVEQLHDGKNINIVFMSNTNRLHHDAITAQYGNKIPGDAPALSYDSGFQKTGPQFIGDYVNLIKQIPDQDIFVVYTPPPALPYPKLGMLSWLAAPFATWAASRGQNYVSSLNKMALSGNFTLVPSKQTAAQPNIAQTLEPFVKAQDLLDQKEPSVELEKKRELRFTLTPTAPFSDHLLGAAATDHYTVGNPTYEGDEGNPENKNKVKFS